jgi:hypothetical protein
VRVSGVIRPARLLCLALALLEFACTGGNTSTHLPSQPAATLPSRAGTPVAEVSPDTALGDGQLVTVSLRRFPPDTRVRLSECAGAKAVNPGGCGDEPANQPFVDLDSDGEGTTHFRVTAFAATGPVNTGELVACQQRCALLAAGVTRSGVQMLVTHQLAFDPAVRRLVGPDSLLPAAGACGRATGTVVTVDVNPDTPLPRCSVVRGYQQLRVVNTSNRFGQRGRTVTIIWPPFTPRTVAVGESTQYHQDFSDYLALGVHGLGISLYTGGYGPQLWLRP